MIETAAVAIGFVALAVAAFVASIRLGILLGRRIDISLEARVAATAEESEAAITPTSGGPDLDGGPDPNRGREELRGE